MTLENKVYSILSQCTQNDETVKRDIKFDFSLENGLKKLNWPPQTYVEVRYKLSYAAYAEIIRRSAVVGDEHLKIVVLDDSSLYRDKINNDNKPHIECITYNELENRCKVRVKPLDEKDLKESQKNLIEKAKYALKSERFTLFLGAGVSISAGVPSWKDLLQSFYKRKSLFIPDNSNYTIIGRYIADTYCKNVDDKYELDNESLAKDLKEILYEKKKESKLIPVIADIARKTNCESVITYNYDDLIEQKLGSKYQSITEKTRYTEKDVIPIYHVHGFVPQQKEPSPIILGEREYHNIYNDPFNWGNIEQLHALTRNTCFFIGLSMEDPNLRRLIDFANKDAAEKLVHYVFLLKEKKDQHESAVNEMESLRLNCIVFDDKDKLPELLKSLIE